MFRSIILFAIGMLCAAMVRAQSDTSAYSDTLQPAQLQEVVIISQRSVTENMAKPLSTLDTYLEKAASVNMIRRGSYAWEPLLNGMASERSVVTIDGMRIYAACTDKMDPVTSYVEITNLAKASIHSGQSGSAAGATIAGSLDLVRKKGDFGGKLLKGSVFTGFESNNRHKMAGTALSYSRPRFFADVDFTWRDAGNYRAGGNKEVLYSRFTKYNMSAMAGYKIDEHRHIEASLIYDRATDVGYPALTMDVSLAKALIGSVEYVRHHISPSVHRWQTKVYYNTITHIMDDTKRPVVPIRMDMPGWSRTAGFYSLLAGGRGRHAWKANFSGHHNRSLAEMTMFSNTPGEKDMFMLTWPGVHTSYADVFLEDEYTMSDRWKATLSGGIAWHNNEVSSQFGLGSLQIFYPGMAQSRTRMLKRAAASLRYQSLHWQYTLGAGYGERAPSVSEGYGFYLFNSFDRFDYIGNPGMNNEKSVTLNGGITYAKDRISAKVTGTYFYVYDYIIGRPHPELSVMTIGAAGVKIYEQLDYAQLFNAALDLDYRLTDRWSWSGRVSYRRGVGKGSENLPLIQPLSYASRIGYSAKAFSADVSVNGAARQQHFNPQFGESALPAYAVMNMSASQRFMLKEQRTVMVKAGVENLWDQNYTTFADWNRLPRMGRNVFVNLLFTF